MNRRKFIGAVAVTAASLPVLGRILPEPGPALRRVDIWRPDIVGYHFIQNQPFKAVLKGDVFIVVGSVSDCGFGLMGVAVENANLSAYARGVWGFAYRPMTSAEITRIADRV